ncbi:LysR family transcriptional regulator [Pokkaliibacter plantistimulans]|uniref:LysR family transcriptional regulator n=1 Tax=Pokkaliibacter plantistimulans TaxID=1635171 RepID=UPI003AF00B97
MAGLSLCRNGRFVAVSERLAVPASAIKKSVVRLEEELGVRLFNRSTCQLFLTDERSLRIIEKSEGAEAKFSLSVGNLRGSIPTIIDYRMLMPVFPAFSECSSSCGQVIDIGFPRYAYSLTLLSKKVLREA